MGQLLFYDTGHKYTLDGEELPSVSELCRFLSREIYGEVAQFRLDNAADRGTKVHKACEILDLYGKADISEDILPYVQAYLAFRKEHAVQWEKIEWQAYHHTDRVAGTVDRAGVLDGEKVIIDLKTTSSISWKHKVLYTTQLSWYKRISDDNGFSAERMFILQLKKDGTYKLIAIEPDEQLALSCLNLHVALKTKPRRKERANVENDQ